MARLAAGILEEISFEGHPVELTQTGQVLANVDAGHVERIIENLVSNAVRYTPSGTPIWISIEGTAGGVTITVEDAGPGIPRSSAKRSSSRSGKGTSRWSTHRAWVSACHSSRSSPSCTAVGFDARSIPRVVPDSGSSCQTSPAFGEGSSLKAGRPAPVANSTGRPSRIWKERTAPRPWPGRPVAAESVQQDPPSN